jgi:hypothetical protein
MNFICYSNQNCGNDIQKEQFSNCNHTFLCPFLALHGTALVSISSSTLPLHSVLYHCLTFLSNKGKLICLAKFFLHTKHIHTRPFLVWCGLAISSTHTLLALLTHSELNLAHVLEVHLMAERMPY